MTDRARDLDRLLDLAPGRAVQRRLRTWRQARSVTVHGVRVELDRRWASPDIRAALYEGWYEWPEIAAIRATLRPGDRFYEVGAGIGVVTTVACRIVGSDRVTAVEANPRLVDVTRATTAANGFAPEILNLVLGDDDQQRSFYVHPDFWASSVTPVPGATPVPVEGRSLDDELERIRPTYLMLDVEGAEVTLLRGRKLPAFVRAVCMEVHPAAVGRAAVQGLLDTLAAQGFALDLGISGHFVAFLERTPSA